MVWPVRGALRRRVSAWISHSEEGDDLVLRSLDARDGNVLKGRLGIAQGPSSRCEQLMVPVPGVSLTDCGVRW